MPGAWDALEILGAAILSLVAIRNHRQIAKMKKGEKQLGKHKRIPHEPVRRDTTSEKDTRNAEPPGN